MKIDDYIAELVKLRQAHGADLQVKTIGRVQLGTISAMKAPLPRIAHTRVGMGSRSLFVFGEHPDKTKGAKVVLV